MTNYLGYQYHKMKRWKLTMLKNHFQMDINVAQEEIIKIKKQLEKPVSLSKEGKT